MGKYFEPLPYLFITSSYFYSVSFPDKVHCKVWYMFSCNLGIYVFVLLKLILNWVALIVQEMFEIKLGGDNTDWVTMNSLVYVIFVGELW